MRTLRQVFVLMLCLPVLLGVVGMRATADVGSDTALNVQEGDNEHGADQSGGSRSGDANAGQVTGVVAAGEASLDATNRSEDVSLESGDASGANSASVFTGLSATATVTVAADVGNGQAFNVEEGDNATAIAQTASAVSGDGVGGQVIGVVTSAGGSADVVSATTSRDVDVTTGDALGENEAAVFTGHNDIATATVAAADVDGDVSGDGFLIGVVHEGDDDSVIDQSAAGASGDGVGGQVVGIVSAGRTSLDATNASEDADISTGDADATNTAAVFTGSTIGPDTSVTAADIEVGETFNVQEGDNTGIVVQSATSSSGDGVGGQVIGAVTAATGAADVVAANTSDEVDVVTGDADGGNAAAAFVGQHGLPVGGATISDIVVDNFATDVQDGDNHLLAQQSAVSASGDAIGGQVLGVVSGGDTVVDATNRSRNAEVTTGDGSATSDVAAFVGQTTASTTAVEAADIDSDRFAFNIQEGDNSAEVTQAAVATGGDAIAGQVAGVVTSARGSADLVAANAGEDAAATSGDAAHHNDALIFSGLNAQGTISVS